MKISADPVLMRISSQVEARQKLILEAEEGKQKNGKAIDPDEVGTYKREF